MNVCAIEIRGDNSAAIAMLNAVSASKQASVGSAIDRLHSILHSLWVGGTIAPKNICSDFAVHVRRCFKKEADSLATLAIENRRSRVVLNSRLRFFPRFVKLCFEGGKRGNQASCGFSDALPMHFLCTSYALPMHFI